MKARACTYSYTYNIKIVRQHGLYVNKSVLYYKLIIIYNFI